ncbi:MAG: EamA family transporter [Vulcanimicrobiota bacterium]
MENKTITRGLALATVYLVWGSTFYAITVGLESIPPLHLIGLRFLVAGAGLYLAARLTGQPAPSLDQWRQQAALGSLLLVLGPGLVAWSEQWVASGLAALLVGTSPLWVTLLDSQKPLTANRLAGVALGLAGLGLLVDPDLLEARQLLATAALLVSALAWAVGSLYARRTHPLPIGLRAGMQMLWAGLLLCLVGTATGERFDPWSTTRNGWLAMAYLTLFGSLLAFWAYNWLLSNCPTHVLATHAYVNPVVALWLGCWLGSEPLSARTVVASLLSLAGVALMTNASESGAGRGWRIRRPASLLRRTSSRC